MAAKFLLYPEAFTSPQRAGGKGFCFALYYCVKRHMAKFAILTTFVCLLDFCKFRLSFFTEM